MTKPIAKIVCLALVCIVGCQAHSSSEATALRDELRAEQEKVSALNQRAEQTEAAKDAAQKQVADLAQQVHGLQKQLADENETHTKLERQLADAKRVQSAADEQARHALADNEVLKGKLSASGTLRTIDGAPVAPAIDGVAGVPPAIQTAFQNGLAWRADLVRSLEIEIRDTPSKVEARSLKAQLDKLKAAPVVPPPLRLFDLTIGQIGPVEIDNYLRVDAVAGDNTIVVTPVRVEQSLTPQAATAGAATAPLAAGSPYTSEGDPIAIQGFATKGVSPGAKIATLPGFYYVEKTEQYGARTVFVLAPVDPNKLRSYFNQMQSEMRSAAKQTPRAGSAAAAK